MTSHAWLALTSSKSINQAIYLITSALANKRGKDSQDERIDNRFCSFSHRVWVFWFCPGGGRSPSVGARSPSCDAQSPLHDASSAPPSAPSPFACNAMRHYNETGLEHQRMTETLRVSAGRSLPEVSLLLCCSSLSKCTACLPHRASCTATSSSTLAQLTQLE